MWWWNRVVLEVKTEEVETEGEERDERARDGILLLVTPDHPVFAECDAVRTVFRVIASRQGYTL